MTEREREMDEVIVRVQRRLLALGRMLDGLALAWPAARTIMGETDRALADTAGHGIIAHGVLPWEVES